MQTERIQNCEFTGACSPLFITDLPGVALRRRGATKDMYDLGDMLLLVSSDRLPVKKATEQGFAGKGKIVNQLSAYWFRKLRNICPNHLVSANAACFPAALSQYDDILDRRSMLVWKTTPLPIVCVVRGYLSGDGWREYRQKGEICGTMLPEGLSESQRLPSPLFSARIKGETEEEIDSRSLQQLLGRGMAEQLRELSLRLYFTAWKSARERGVLIAETSFEFGSHNGRLLLIDECLTPDTSRFWAIDSYRYGGPMPGMDRQLVVEYLEGLDDRDGEPDLPEELLRRTGEKYYEAYRRIVGRRACSQKEIFGV